MTEKKLYVATRTFCEGDKCVLTFDGNGYPCASGVPFAYKDDRPDQVWPFGGRTAIRGEALYFDERRGEVYAAYQ